MFKHREFASVFIVVYISEFYSNELCTLLAPLLALSLFIYIAFYLVLSRGIFSLAVDFFLFSIFLLSIFLSLSLSRSRLLSLLNSSLLLFFYFLFFALLIPSSSFLPLPFPFSLVIFPPLSRVFFSEFSFPRPPSQPLPVPGLP